MLMKTLSLSFPLTTTTTINNFIFYCGQMRLTNSRGSRVAGRGSRVAGRGSRVAGRGSKVAGRGSRVQSGGRGSNVAAGENHLEFEVTERQRVI